MVNRMQAAAHISEGVDGSVERLRLRLQTLLHDSAWAAGSFLLRGTFLQRGNLRLRSILQHILACAPGRAHVVTRLRAAAHFSEGADGSVERPRLRLQTLLHDSAESIHLATAVYP